VHDAMDLGAMHGAMDVGTMHTRFSHPLSRLILVFFLPLLGFFLCTLRPTSSIELLDREKLDFIHRSSRARYSLTLRYFFRIDLVKWNYILNLWTSHVLCSCAF
jgi:hypothetical protein